AGAAMDVWVRSRISPFVPEGGRVAQARARRARRSLGPAASRNFRPCCGRAECAHPVAAPILPKKPRRNPFPERVFQGGSCYGRTHYRFSAARLVMSSEGTGGA